MIKPFRRLLQAVGIPYHPPAGAIELPMLGEVAAKWRSATPEQVNDECAYKARIKL